MSQPIMFGEQAKGEEEEQAERYSLLYEPLISVRHNGAVSRKTLPEVYAVLANNEVDDLPFLRPHQRHFWHATLCQIGAMAMINAGVTDPPESPSAWTEIIQGLTQERFPGGEPWNLVTEDITKPAFLQPGASTRARATDYRKPLETPDEMDLPVGSKHHDVRECNMRRATPEMWLFALVARQSGGGYDGPKLYQASRMNSGTGNRHGFSITPSTRWGPHVCRDLRSLAQKHHGREVKHLLIWTRTWDGTAEEEIPLHTLEPMALYVEVTRRIRLETDGKGNLRGTYATSETPRVHAREVKGMTQDPWTITETDKAVTVGGTGFGYRQVARYLDPDRYTLPELAEPGPADNTSDGMYLVARAVARGNGKTEGYHEKAIPLRVKAAGMLRNRGQQAELHRIADERLKTVAEVQSILGHAVKTYLQNGESSGQTKKEHQKVISNARNKLNQAIEGDFWNHLQEELESEDRVRTRWDWHNGVVVPQARKILESVCQSSLNHHLDRYKATTEAEDLFGRRIANSNKLPSKP